MKSAVKLVSLVSVVVLGAGLIGCNTLDGFGKDLTVAGTALSGAVSKDDKKAQQPVAAQPAANTAQPQTTYQGPAPAPQRR